MSKYKLTATNEAYVLDKLSIAADTDSSFATAESTTDNNITQVGIRINGGTPIKTNLSSGVANFSNLNTTIAADGYIYIEVLADFNTIAGGATTGATPRLGIYQIQNANNTFRAVGQGSSTVANYTTTSEANVTGEENVYAMTVRKTMPTVAKATGLSTTMSNGTNTLYSFTVAADSHEAVALKRFKLTTTASADISVVSLKLYRGTTDITDKVLIYKEGAGNGTMENATDLITGTSANSVYFVWDGTTEEVVPAGQTYTYTVYATVSGIASNNSIISYIADDITVLPTTTGVLAIGGYESTTGWIYDAAGTTIATNDIRITATDTFTATETTDAGNELTVGAVSLAYGMTNASTITIATDADNTLGAALVTTTETEVTCTPKSIADVTLTAASTVDDLAYVICTGTGKSYKVITTTTAGDNAANNLVITIGKTAGGYTSGSVVGASDSDVGLTVNAASTTHNFVWSDNSVTSHSVTAGSDWTNGYLVDSLATSSLAITAP
jgi:hypothetical protein